MLNGRCIHANACAINYRRMNHDHLVYDTFIKFFKHTWYDEAFKVPHGYIDPVRNIRISCMFRLVSNRGDYDTFMVCDAYKDGKRIGKQVYD
jgi:hypothetical protein